MVAKRAHVMQAGCIEPARNLRVVESFPMAAHGAPDWLPGVVEAVALDDVDGDAEGGG